MASQGLLLFVDFFAFKYFFHIWNRRLANAPKSPGFLGSVPRAQTLPCPSLPTSCFWNQLCACVCTSVHTRLHWERNASLSPPMVAPSLKLGLSSNQYLCSCGLVLCAIRSHLLLAWLQVGSLRSPFEITALWLPHKWHGSSNHRAAALSWKSATCHFAGLLPDTCFSGFFFFLRCECSQGQSSKHWAAGRMQNCPISLVVPSPSHVYIYIIILNNNSSDTEVWRTARLICVRCFKKTSDKETETQKDGHFPIFRDHHLSELQNIASNDVPSSHNGSPSAKQFILFPVFFAGINNAAVTVSMSLKFLEEFILDDYIIFHIVNKNVCTRILITSLLNNSKNWM